ncbi:MAG: NAD(P)-dependent oxidoreductase [Acidimicrobiales bacterium]|nr:NAD(P)-dependent oxidoreductase [Acidimicrobiales bacterium]
MPLDRVAFIGLGNMGAPMARNLIAAGFQTSVSDLDATKMNALVTAGGTAAKSVAMAASAADVVFTSLPGPSQVRTVAEELLPAMEPGGVWIDLSTNDLVCARVIGPMAETHGVELLDAPVSGGVEGAVAGTLTVMVGGDESTFSRCRPLFEAIGERIELLGPHGAGYVAKIAQVMLCYLNSVCLTEALVLGAKGGVAPAKMLDIIRNSTGRSYVADQYGPEILSGRYDDTFDLGLAAKDLRLTMELAHAVGARLDFTQAVSDLYATAEASFGFSAPHLMAMQEIERQNELVLSETIPTKGR